MESLLPERSSDMDTSSDSSFVLKPEMNPTPERRLAEAERKFSALFEKGPIGVAFHVMIRDESGKAIDYRFLDANQTYQKLTGVDPRGKTVKEAFPGIELDPFDWIGTFGNVALTGEEIRFEQYLASNDRWYDVVGYQYKPDHFVAAFIEITERKHAEARLRDSNERLKLATRAGGVGIWDWDVVANRLVWDEQMFRLYGIATQDFSGAYDAWKNGLHPEDREASHRASQLALSGEKEFDIEFRVVCPDGEVRTLKGNASVFRDPQGNPLRMIGTNWDITESREHARELARYRDHLEERIQERTAELEAANRELEAFSYMVSHDLRAPLRHINGFVEILTSDHKDDLGADAQHALRVIASSARNMSQLIDDLLSFARTTRQPLVVSPLQMGEILEEALVQVRKSCPDRNIEWVAAPMPQIEGDAGLLRQVWINLLDNAVKYSRRQELARIEIGCAQTDREWTFWVRDNGVGFDMKCADKLFGVFQRLHRPDEFEGTGIGLVTVQRIVVRHKGRIWAESAPDQGATFTFALPKPTESERV
jgi:PAS domain S-box-containing protein